MNWTVISRVGVKYRDDHTINKEDDIPSVKWVLVDSGGRHT